MLGGILVGVCGLAVLAVGVCFTANPEAVAGWRLRSGVGQKSARPDLEVDELFDHIHMTRLIRTWGVLLVVLGTFLVLMAGGVVFAVFLPSP